MGQHFNFKDLGKSRYFLGLEIAQNTSGISICQRKYVLDLLHDTCLLGCKPSIVPMDPTLHIQQEGSTPLQDATSYMRLIGRLQYLCYTRPDITFAVNRLSQYLSQPHQHHPTAARKVLRYLKGSIGLGLFYSSSYPLEANVCLQI